VTDYAAEAARLLDRVRRAKPLIHHITNLVVMNDTANVTLAAGALPVMAHAREEVEEMASAAAALVLNIGTLSPPWIESMLAAGRLANQRGIPVILDPVGAGATRLRTEGAMRLLADLRIAVVRGNLGELAHLAGKGGVVRGVESLGAGASPEDVASAVAGTWRCVAAVTGPRDHVTDGRRMLAVDNGHPLLTRLTGTGCMATTAIACFAAVADDLALASAAGLAYFGYAAELAAADARGPGSFRAALLDQLAALDGRALSAGARIENAVVPEGSGF
jgi:hydroxyethylthiazole kinase